MYVYLCRLLLIHIALPVCVWGRLGFCLRFCSLNLLLATIASSVVVSTAAGNIAPHDPVNNIAEFVEKNKVIKRTH